MPWRRSEETWFLATLAEPGKCELRLGRIDPLYFVWRASLSEQLGERATAAADVDPSQARGRRQPIEEDLPSELAPDAHPAVVGCSIIEPNGLLGHSRPPSDHTAFAAKTHWS